MGVVVLLYGESRRFEVNFLQYDASALLQNDNFSEGAIMKMVQKKLKAILQNSKKGKALFTLSIQTSQWRWRFDWLKASFAQ